MWGVFTRGQNVNWSSALDEQQYVLHDVISQTVGLYCDSTWNYTQITHTLCTEGVSIQCNTLLRYHP